MILQAVEAAVGVLRSGSVTDADVARGKAQLKARVLEGLDNSGTLVEDIGAQAALTGKHNICPYSNRQLRRRKKFPYMRRCRCKTSVE